MKRTLRAGPFVFRDPVLLCGVLYGLLWFDASGFLRIGLWAAFLHECGHVAAYLAMLHEMPTLEVNMTGFCMRTRGKALMPQQIFWLAAAGPLTNALLAALWAGKLSDAATIRGSAFLAANLLTGAFNLLPIPPLDGAQMGLALREALRQRNQGLQFPRKSGKIKRMKKRSVNGGT